MIVSSQNSYHPERNVHPENNGSSTFHWDGLTGIIYHGVDDFDQPESIIVIRDGELDAPATISITGTSPELAGSSLKRLLEDLP